MEQHVDEPTHLSGNILDLILCDQEGIINSVKTIGRIGKSDHETISFKIMVDGRREEKQNASWNFRKANFQEMRKSCQRVEWRRELEGRSVNEMWICIREYMNEWSTRWIPRRNEVDEYGDPKNDRGEEEGVEEMERDRQRDG